MKRLLIIWLIICFLCSVCTIGASAAEFTDVYVSDWFCKEVDYVCENGLMNGVGGDKFDPNGTMTRAMIVTVLYRLSGAEKTEALASFEDVLPGSYYEDAVAWAAERGIVTGYTQYSFGPDDPITREQLATILFRYADAYGYDMLCAEDISSYSDYDQVGSYAMSAMEWANGTGLITGTSASTLSPKGNATRAQVAVILYRFCEEVIKSASEEEKAYTVTFMLNDEDTDQYITQKVREGDTAEKPQDPQRPNYSFLGWYTEAEEGIEFDFNTTITEDLKLYAHWELTEEDIQQPSEDESGESEKNDVDESRNNVFLLTQTYLKERKTLSVTLILCGNVDLCGFDMKLQYDKDKLSLNRLNTKYDLSLVACVSAESGTIFFNYAGANNITEEKMILTATFDVIGDAATMSELVLKPIEVIKTDEKNYYDIIDAEYTIEYRVENL